MHSMEASSLSQSRVLQRSTHGVEPERLERLSRKVSAAAFAILAVVALVSVGVGMVLGVTAGLITAALSSLLAWKIQMSEGKKVCGRLLRPSKKKKPERHHTSQRQLEQSDLIHVSQELPRQTVENIQEIRDSCRRLATRTVAEPFSDTSSLDSFVGEQDVLHQLKKAYLEMKTSDWSPLVHHPLKYKEKSQSDLFDERKKVYFSARAIAEGRDYLSTNGMNVYNVGKAPPPPEKIAEFPPIRPPTKGSGLKVLITPHLLESILGTHFAEMEERPPLVWVLGHLSSFIGSVKQLQLDGLLESYYLRSTLSIADEEIQKLGPIPEGGAVWLPVKVFLRSEELGFAQCPTYQVNFFVTSRKEKLLLRKGDGFKEALQKLLRFAFTKGHKKIVIHSECVDGLSPTFLKGFLEETMRQDEFRFSPEIYLLLSKTQWHQLKDEKSFKRFEQAHLFSADEFPFASRC